MVVLTRPQTLLEELRWYMGRARCPIWPENWGKRLEGEYYRLLHEQDHAVCQYESRLERRRRDKEGEAFAKERGVEYDSDEHTPSPPPSPYKPIILSPEVMTPELRASRALRSGLETYQPMYLMSSHFDDVESRKFRSRFISSGGLLAPDSDFHKTTFFLTKVRTAKRAKLDLRSSGIWTEDTEGDQNDVLTVINIDWLHKSWEAEKLLAINDYIVYRGRKITKQAFDRNLKRRWEDDTNAAGAKRQQRQ